VAALERAVVYATRAGTLVVMSAGNEAQDLRFDGNRIRWPCEAKVGVCVSATDRLDRPTFYTNRGTNAISVAAPGGHFDGDAARSSVLGPCSTHSLAIPECRQEGVYLFLDGTSMAAPHVAGAAALLDAEHGGRLDPARLRALLEQTAEDLAPPGADGFYGKGRIDACRLVGCLAGH
jgi:subtilisin family serine protease